MTQTPTTTADLMRRLLDGNYEQAAAAALNAISASVQTGLIAERLAQVDAEAQALEAAGERFDPANPVLRALTADLDAELQRDTVRLSDGAALTRTAGLYAASVLVRQLALPNVTPQQLAQVGIRWNTPSAESVNALVNFLNSAGWAAEIKKYPSLVLQTVNNQAIRGFVEGWGARRTAREIRLMTESVPVSHANTLMRTIQLQSYRSASVLHQLANADILTEQVRIATLDSRTCLACLALHGTHLPIGERIDDHWNGRCTSISIVRGRPREVRTGEEWLNAQPEEAQREQLGHAAFEAWKAGRVQLREFVHTYQDATFGTMIREQSLKGLLGEAAREFYSR